MGNWRVWIIVLVVLVAGVLYVQHSKNRRVSAKEPIFASDKESVQKVAIVKRADSVELVNDGGKRHIAGNDTLEVRENRITDLFDRVLKASRTTLMTEKADRWKTYSVDDSTGTILTVLDWDGNQQGRYVFGSSMSDWGKNYVRIGDDPRVYLMDASVIYHLNTMDTFWGEMPKPPEPDSTAAVPDSLALQGTEGDPDSVTVEVDYE